MEKGTKVRWGSPNSEHVGTVLDYNSNTDQYLVRFVSSITEEATTNWFRPEELIKEATK